MVLLGYTAYQSVHYIGQCILITERSCLVCVRPPKIDPTVNVTESVSF
jgi:hypothetical protein